MHSGPLDGLITDAKVSTSTRRLRVEVARQPSPCGSRAHVALANRAVGPAPHVLADRAVGATLTRLAHPVSSRRVTPVPARLTSAETAASRRLAPGQPAE